MTDTPSQYVPYVQGPTQHAAPPVPPRPAPPKRNRTALVATVAAAAALLVGVTAGAMLATGKGPIDALKAAAGAGSFTVQGSITLTGDSYAASTTCTGKGPIVDIAEGAAVTVTDAAGAVVDIGRLGAGHLETASCVLDFAVADVPAGKSFYGIEVAHRGAVKYSEAELSTGRLELRVA